MHTETLSTRHRRRLAFAGLLLCVALGWLLGQSIISTAEGVGPLTVDDSGHWFEYAGNGEPYFLAGSGGPEGFLYESDARKQSIVDQLIEHDVRAVYVHAVRAFGGDGGADQHPFLDRANPSAGVDPDVLDNWDAYLSQLDDAGIVVWFHLYDDGARPFGACNPDLPGAERAFVRTIVERFRSYQHLVWLPTEEHQVKGCADGATDIAKAEALAAEIRRRDDVHPLGVHHNNGQSNQYLGNTDIDVFAQQTCGRTSVRSPGGLHSESAFGEDVYVMAECHPWHKELLAAGDRTTIRRSLWGSVLGGGYVLLYDAFEATDPTPAMLADIGRINEFMDRTSFSEMAPADGLATAGTRWVLGNPELDVYVLYASDGPDRMGVEGLTAGTYRVLWFDPVDGSGLDQTVTVAGGTTSFAVPAGLGDEIVVSVERQGDAPTTTTTTIAPTTVAPTTTTIAPTTVAPTTTTTVGADGSFGPIDDAYLENGRGIDREVLRVETGTRERVTYLRFDVGDTDLTAGARLALTVADDPGAGTLTVHQGSSTGWSEADLGAANAPTAGAVLGSTSGTFTEGATIEIDLAPTTADGGLLELVVRTDSGGSRDASFHSAETDDGPVLTVGATGDGPVPTTTTTTTTTTEVPVTTTTTTPAGPPASIGESADGTSAVYTELPRGTERRRWVDCDPHDAEGVWVCATFDIRSAEQLRGAHDAAIP
ncbi:MAG: hypothetical protein AAFZ07_05050 [Actinomycetota bacterium]